MALVIGFGSGSKSGWGSGYACVNVDRGLLGQNVAGDVAGVGLPPGSSVSAVVLDLCVDHPLAFLRAALPSHSALRTLVPWGFLLLARRLLRGPRPTAYSRPTARRLRVGWGLIGGSLTVATVEVLASQTPYSDGLSGVSWWNAPARRRAHGHRAGHLRPDHEDRYRDER